MYNVKGKKEGEVTGWRTSASLRRRKGRRRRRRSSGEETKKMFLSDRLQRPRNHILLWCLISIICSGCCRRLSAWNLEFFDVLDAKIETNLWPFGELSSSVTVLHLVPVCLVAEERLLRIKHLLYVLVTENRAEILFFLHNFLQRCKGFLSCL